MTRHWLEITLKAGVEGETSPKIGPIVVPLRDMSKLDMLKQERAILKTLGTTLEEEIAKIEEGK